MYAAFRWALGAGVLLLAACGGGGKDTRTESRSTATYDLTVANRNFLTSTRSWTLTGTGPANAAASATLKTTASAGTVTFPPTGVTAGFNDLTLSIAVADATVTAIIRHYFDPASFLPIGARLRDHSTGTDSCSVQNTPPVYPSVARLGETGSDGTSTGYVSCLAGAAIEENATSTWSLESSGGLVLLCSTEVTTEVGTGAVTTTKACNELNADNTIGNRMTLTISGPDATFSLSN